MFDLSQILYKVTKPARYTGGEWNSIIKHWGATPLRFALAYPDVYEIGMSNLAVPVLYDLLNKESDVLAERVFTPWVDMEAAMREKGIPLFSLETKHPLAEFDVIGFSLGYEFTYTNVLNMLDLAQLPVFATERNDSHPLVIAGGACAVNPEPLVDFVDLFVIGEGEEVLLELVAALRSWKKSGKSAKKELLTQLARIPGVYVPSLYEVQYNEDGTVKSITPTSPNAPAVIQRRVVSKLPPPPTKPVVPYIEVIHDRASIEIQRGCTRGCRFCQAGVIYRPTRERTPEEILSATSEIVSNCGYDEVSLLSLSTSDYEGIDNVAVRIMEQQKGINFQLSLPSLRMSPASIKLLDTIGHPRSTGLTFAPEAGSERMRRVINKNLTEEQILEAAQAAFDMGWKGLKLYFMIGLPTETLADIDELTMLVDKIFKLGSRADGRRPQLRLSFNTFIPKPHTPFQWAPQDTEEKLAEKYDRLKRGIKQKSIKLSWSEPKVALLEAVLARGDRRLGQVIYKAWQNGSHFDAWSEHFRYSNWLAAFQECGLDPAFYAYRDRPLDEVLPWSHIDVGASVAFMKREYQKALADTETPDCRTESCQACGLQRFHLGCQKRAAA